jgi:hypothetical protein
MHKKTGVSEGALPISFGLAPCHKRKPASNNEIVMKYYILVLL